MSQECHSDIFSAFWQDRLTVVMRERARLTLADVLPEVWTPVFTQSETLLEQFRGYFTSFTPVHQLFKYETTEVTAHNIHDAAVQRSGCSSVGRN